MEEKVIIGLKHSQVTESALVGGIYTVKVWMKIEESPDLKEWTAVEFSSEAVGEDFQSAFNEAVSGVLDYLYERGQVYEDGQALPENH